jgi:Flp pilus assembly pilin Flp
MTTENRPEQEIREITEEVAPSHDCSQHESPTCLARTGEKEQGASLVEYALLVALIAVVAIAAVNQLGRTVSGQFSSINNTISG